MINSDYRAPLLFRNRHLQTIYPALFRTVPEIAYQRERITTGDQDFLDLDWSKVGGDCLAIISHGLEGNSQRADVKGMVRALNRAGIDAVAWNFRGCSGETNRRLSPYHNGDIADLQEVVEHAMAGYRMLVLVGFSMGGNMSLAYLGQKARALPKKLKGCVTFSVPCDLAAAADALARRENRLYMKRFLRLLHEKIKAKQALFPAQIDDRGYSRLKNFKDFDDRYTAPLNGFADADDYWRKCSCRDWLKEIGIATLIVNSLDDPFLSDGCYPFRECAENPHLHLEITRHGGHVGFMAGNRNDYYWSEQRTLQFIGNIQQETTGGKACGSIALPPEGA